MTFLKYDLPFYILLFYNLAFLVVSVCFVFQRNLYFFEAKSSFNDPKLRKKISLKSEDDTVIDLRFINNNSKIDIYLAFGNVLQEELYLMVNNITEYKFNIFTYIPRGFLGNKGNPSEKSITEDLKEIAAFLNKRNTLKYGFGYSFGCSFVLKLGNLIKFEKIVLSNPFISLRNVVKSKIKILSWLLIDSWDNLILIKKIKTKILIFTSENDKIVLPYNSEVLQKCNEDITQKILKGGEHNDIFTPKHFKRSIVDVIDVKRERS